MTNRYAPGDTAWLRFNDEDYLVTISRVYIDSGGVLVDALSPPRKFNGIPESSLFQKPPACKTHQNKKLYNEREGEYFCPFCEP